MRVCVLNARNCGNFTIWIKEEEIYKETWIERVCVREKERQIMKEMREGMEEGKKYEEEEEGRRI